MRVRRRWRTFRLLLALVIVSLAAGALAVLMPGTAFASIPGCLAGEIVGVASTAYGYRLAGADGGVFSYGDAKFFGSMAGKPLNKPIVGIVSTADGNGYWLIGADGGVFAFGDAAAPSRNPLPGEKLNAPVVGAARAGTTGLELTAAGGGVFGLGGARYLGSMAGHSLAKPVSGIAVKPGSVGYWLTARDGGVFAFGSAGFFGNAVSTSCTVPPTSGSTIVQDATAIMNGQAERLERRRRPLLLGTAPALGLPSGPALVIPARSSHARPQARLASTAPASRAGSTRWPTATTYLAAATPTKNCRA